MKDVYLLIKPASGLCNLRCQYCFYRDEMENRSQQSYGMMTEETLENIISKVLNNAEQSCTIAFQGGEPTLIGLDYFKKSVALVQKYNHKGLKINYTLQTNGYCITDEWAHFFSNNNFLVGLSLDGIKKTHNAFRHNEKGEGTFNEIMSTARLFNRCGVEYNILTVINRKTAENIEEIYQFYRRNHFQHMQFIPCLNPLGHENVKYSYTLTPRAYGEFLKKLFDLWYKDFTSGEQIYIRQFENYIEMLLGYAPECCGMSGICSYQYVIEADGEVYPCDFYVLDEYKLGNLNHCDFNEINQRRKEIAFLERSAKFKDECRNCQYFFICRGGCIRYRESYPSDEYQINCLCEGNKAFFAYALPRFQDLARKLARNF